VPDPGNRDGTSEEVLPDATAARLRLGAGRLENLVDSCVDWERPPARGIYMVACSPKQLQSYFDSGLENTGTSGLHIDVADADAPEVGPITVPAVRRDARGRSLDNWRLAASGAITTEVYVACPAEKGRLEARFPVVRLQAEQRLRLDDSERTTWYLRDEHGTEVARATPKIISAYKVKRLACG
jgi:hypothetical protein